MIPNVLAALCSALHPLAGRVDPAPDKNTILIKTFYFRLTLMSEGEMCLHSDE